jgi:hypothetical protein
MRNIVPAVIVAMVSKRNPTPGSVTSPMPRRWIVSMIPGRKGFDWGFSSEIASSQP